MSNPPRRLIDLDPSWWGDGSGDGRKLGVTFACPLGPDRNCGGYHGVPFENPIGGGTPQSLGSAGATGPLWRRAGETFETLTLVPSINTLTGCRWHGFITCGEVTSV